MHGTALACSAGEFEASRQLLGNLALRMRDRDVGCGDQHVLAAVRIRA